MSSPKSSISGWVWGILYLLAILVANWMVVRFGIVNFFGIVFPAGALMIGLTFSFRDMVQRHFGHYKVWLFMITATVITYFYNQNVALASVAAFLVSELVDWFVFLVLKKDLKWRIIVSNLFSTPLDSIIFVTIAFGWQFDAIWGQTIVKYVFGLLVLPVLFILDMKRKRTLHETS
jgi:queuosine precursor transporter